MNRRQLVAVAIALACVTATPATARHHKAKHHQVQSHLIEFCGDRYCGPQAVSREVTRRDASGNSGRYRGYRIWDRVPIPTPAGTWRVVKSCGQRLAAYWNLGPGLDGTWDWPRRFERASAPGPRVAVVMPGHVMGIVGGQEGAWRVVSFNGTKHHGNVEFTISKLPGILVDTTRPKHGSRMASR